MTVGTASVFLFLLKYTQAHSHIRIRQCYTVIGIHSLKRILLTDLTELILYRNSDSSNVRKPQNPLRRENNKLIKLYLLKNKKCMIPSMIFGTITLWVQKLNAIYHFTLVWLFCRSFPCDYNECRLKLLSLRTQKHHKSIIKVVHLNYMPSLMNSNNRFVWGAEIVIHK